jgi:hypothetical protein
MTGAAAATERNRLVAEQQQVEQVAAGIVAEHRKIRS